MAHASVDLRSDPSELCAHDSLQKYCFKLKSFLKLDVYYCIDGLDLFSELKVLKEILQIKEYTPIDILNYIKNVRFISKHMHYL